MIPAPPRKKYLLPRPAPPRSKKMLPRASLVATSCFFSLDRLPGRPQVPGRVSPISSNFSSGIFRLLREELNYPGTRKEVPPPCCYLMTRGGVGEVNNPAGGARGGGGVRGGRDIFQEGFQLKAARCMGRPRHLHIHWRRLRAAQWTPTKDWISLLWVGPG